MTTLTLQRGMNSDERESVFMSIHIPYYFTPPADAVTLFTVASKLTSMDIRVANGTLFPDGRKDQLYMALRTVQTGMHSLQRESGAAMIKVRKWTNWFKSSCIMAFHACYFDCAMRTKRSFLRP